MGTCAEHCQPRREAAQKRSETPSECANFSFVARSNLLEKSTLDDRV
jgi:hypothetical protein